MNKYEAHRSHFIRKTRVHFAFLVHALGFDNPVHRTTLFTNSDGSIFPITDFITYSLGSTVVEIRNEYPPHGHGFQVDVVRYNGTELLTDIVYHAPNNQPTTTDDHIRRAAAILRIYFGVEQDE